MFSNDQLSLRQPCPNNSLPRQPQRANEAITRHKSETNISGCNNWGLRCANMGLHDEMEEGKTKEADEAFNQALELKTKGEVSRGC